MKGAKDFDVREFAPESSATGTIAVGADVRPSKRSVSSEQSELTERNGIAGQTLHTPLSEVAGQTVPTPSGGRVEEITPTPLSEQTAKPRQSTPTSTTERSVPSQQIERPQQNDSTQSAEQVQSAQPTTPTQQRISTRQRRASLDEYKEIFLSIPKITDRQPVFVSRDVRNKIDGVVRRLGERKMSVSGFLENLARHHLGLYADDLEQWKRL